MLESWDAAEDSEVEREKAKKAAEAKAKAEAEAKANHKTKTQRMQERIAQHKKELEDEDDDESDEETEAEKRARLKRQEREADLAHTEDLFGNIGINPKRSTVKPVTVEDPADSANTIDLSTLPLFNPTTKDQFAKLRETLAPLITANSKKPQYSLFLQEFSKQLAKELSSEQIKKISTALSTMSNEKMKAEKEAEKGGKKTKAQKTKTTLAATKDVSSKAADLDTYDDFGE